MARKTADEKGKASALDRALHGMFRSLEARPVPGAIMSVVEQLDEPEKLPLKKSG
jgi:hypothetical protein